MTTHPGPGGGRDSLTLPPSGPDELSKLVRGLLAVLGSVAVVLLGAGVAWAYWSAGGVGVGSAGTGGLAAPGNVAAVAPANSASVTVSWDAVEGRPGVPVTGYYVQRWSGGPPSPACGSSPGALIAPPATSCVDSAVANGTYTYTVTAVYGSWTAESSPSAPVTVDRLEFLVQAPASAVAGSAFTVTVSARDGAGNLRADYRDTVSFSSSDPGSPVLPADYRFKAGDNGSKTFTNDVTLYTSGTQSITVTDTVVSTSDGTTSVAVSAAAASRLAFSAEPGGGTSDVAWAAQPQVTVQDAYGNTVTLSSDSVTLAILSGPGGAVLTCTSNPKAATAGIVGFAGCRIDKAGSYTLQATSGALTAATSVGFTVTHGPATKVAFSTQPSSVVAGSSISPDVVVTVQDAAGNTVTSSSATVTVAIGTNPGAGILSGTASRAAVSGVSTFPGLSINRSGVGYTLTGASGGLTGATSTTFDVSHGPADRVVFTVQPGNGTGGTAFSTQPRVTVQDALGNTVTNSSATVTLTISTNPPGNGVLSGTAAVAASSGVVTYAGLSIDRSGTGYRLTASSGALTVAVSNTFNITVGTAVKLGFTVQPGNAVAGGAIPSLSVAVQDAGGNTVTASSAMVTVAMGNDPSTGATLSGTTAVAASGGVATFTTLSLDKSGVGFTLDATSPGLTSATSAAFTVTHAAANRVVFSVQPGGGSGGTAWATQPRATIQDAFGNTVTNWATNVVLTKASGPGGTLACTATTVTPSAGVATYANCSINTQGTYTLQAASGALTVAISQDVVIAVGPASRLAFGQQPTNVVAGSSISPAVTVLVQDAGGNTVSSSSATISVSITNPAGATLNGTLSRSAASGVASYSDLWIDKTGTGYTLTALSTGLTGATSNTFNVTHAPAAQLEFSTQPGGAAANVNLAPQPKVTVRDAYGNIVTATTSVTISITAGTGTSGAGLTCGGSGKTRNTTLATGVVNYTGCKIDMAGSGYTLTATASDRTPAVISTTLTIT